MQTGTFSLRRRKHRGKETVPGVAHQAARTSLPGTDANSEERRYGQRPIKHSALLLMGSYGFNVERLGQTVLRLSARSERLLFQELPSSLRGVFSEILLPVGPSPRPLFSENGLSPFSSILP